MTNSGFVGYSTFGAGRDPIVGAESVRFGDRIRETPKQRAAFNSVRKAEVKYARQLRDVAKQVGVIVSGLIREDDEINTAQIEKALRAYAELLKPWARTVGKRMLVDVSRREYAVWKSMSADLSAGMRAELAEAPTGEALRRLLDEQVTLITSMPLKAAERCQKLALEAMLSGRRHEDIVDEIRRTGKVTESRARLIARTEVARASSGLTQARATHVGSEGYVWRTAEDGDVRKSHKKMAGRFVKWSEPPTTDNLVGHAGQLPNCRCYPEPVLPDFIQ